MSCYWEGQADVSESEYRTAKKPHVCDACRETIAPGTGYEREAVLYEGSWDITKRCLRCEAIYQVLQYNNRGSDWEEGIDRSLSCGHDYQEVWHKEPPEQLAALAFMKGEELTDLVLVLHGFTQGMISLGHLCHTFTNLRNTR